MTTHFWILVLVCGVVAMVLGFLWYGPLFGKTWMRVVGATDMDAAARKKMQKKAGPLYLIQFVLTVFQIFVLAHLTGFTWQSGVESAIWVWAAFILPTVAGSSMWNNDPRSVAWTRFLLQAGFQLLCFIVFGIILGTWL